MNEVTIASSLSGKLALKHPKLRVLCREDGIVFNRIAGSRKRFRWTKGYLVSCGYLQIRSNDKMRLVHRLIAEAFLENPENLPQVDHIDRNKQNNTVSNLKWVTCKDNMTNRDDVDRSLALYSVRWCEDKKAYNKAHNQRLLALKTPEGKRTASGALPPGLYKELKPLSPRERYERYRAWKQSLSK